MLDLFTNFLGKWVDPLYYIAYWAAGLIGVLASDKMMNTNKRLFKKPTLLGWSFIFCIIFAFLLSFVKDNKQNKEAKDFQDKFLQSENERKIADTKYTNKLEDIDKGLIRRDTIWLNQLDKWGLKLKDSMIIKKDAPFISYADGQKCIEKRTKGDTDFVTITVCNTGNAPAKNVQMTIYLLLGKNDSFFKTKVIFSKIESIDMAAGGCVAANQYYIKHEFSPFRNGYNEYYIIIGSCYDVDARNKYNFDLQYEYTIEGHAGIYNKKIDLNLELKKAKSIYLQ